MKYSLLLCAVPFLFFFGQPCSAQTQPNPLLNNDIKIIRCYTVEVINNYRKIHPNAETDVQFENWLGKKIQARKAQRVISSNYIIPIIFHVISNGEAEAATTVSGDLLPNISAAIINEQMVQLNKDYANLSGSPYSVSANTGIQFVLAKTDNNGNTLAEPGIDRINISTKGWTDYTTNGWDHNYIDGTVKPNSIWNPNNYYNVWVIPKISNNSPIKTLLGYATFPSSSTLSGLDGDNGETNTTAGVVVQTGTIGSIFTPFKCISSFGKGKTLSHETGHFFGLRHIWGDSNCGTDYCDDTPVHFTYNAGTPAHPKPNSCGTQDEMFENYMDYTDDVDLNTFTANQVDRMQTVMTNSPRRISLATSTAATTGVSASGTNAISFNNCSGNFTVPETGTNTTYPRYKDLYFTINPDNLATGSATVTLSITGTAVSGTDYQLLTPSTLTFTAGDGSKKVNIRILDNAQVDGDRTIILNYNISGNGVVAGTSAQTLTVNIIDDDNIKIGEKSINLLNETFESPTGTFGLPAGWGLLRTRDATTGVPYPNPFVGGSNGDAGGSGNCAYISNNTTSKPNSYTKGIDGAALLQSPKIVGSSVLSIGTLSFNYKVKGLGGSDYAYATYTHVDQPGDPFQFGNTGGLTGFGPYFSNTATIANAPVLTPDISLNNTSFYINFLWITGGTSTAGGDPGLNVDNVVLTGTPFHVETAVSSSYGYDLKANKSVNNFKSTNNNALVSVDTISENVANITAKVIQSGIDSVQIITTGGTFLRTHKVFQITPASANSTATYQATFYFTEAELASWGVNKLNLKILKVIDGVDLTSSLSASDAQIITPTVVENTAAGYIAYTGKFTGFSQFMLVSPEASITAIPGSTVKTFVSPNPASDNLYIYITGTTSKVDIALINAVGQKIKQATGVNAYGSFYKMPITSIARGVYTVLIVTEGGITYTNKIVIE